MKQPPTCPKCHNHEVYTQMVTFRGSTERLLDFSPEGKFIGEEYPELKSEIRIISESPEILCGECYTVVQRL